MKEIFSKKILAIFLIFLFGFSSLEGRAKKKQAFAPLFIKSFKSAIQGIKLATSSGDFVVYGKDWLSYFNARGKQVWKKKDFKYICGVGISRDGQVVLYQTSSVPKTGPQTTLDLTVHIADGTGKELLSVPNPYRYFYSLLSPKGNYIVFGDPMAKKIYVYERNLNRLWERETYLWYINFDPEEEFIYDSAFGLVLNMKGRRVWELPRGMKFLSISARAEIILSCPFLLVKSKNQIYLTARTTLEQVIFQGLNAVVSYDGALVAFQNLEKEVQLWRTRDLIGSFKGEKPAHPLWKEKTAPVKFFNISFDNQTLFIQGETEQGITQMELIDLVKLKRIWEKGWSLPPEKLFIGEENQVLVLQQGANLLEYYQLR